jgi:hypothetical protein
LGFASLAAFSTAWPVAELVHGAMQGPRISAHGEACGRHDRSDDRDGCRTDREPGGAADRSTRDLTLVALARLAIGMLVPADRELAVLPGRVKVIDLDIALRDAQRAQVGRRGVRGVEVVVLGDQDLRHVRPP